MDGERSKEKQRKPPKRLEHPTRRMRESLFQPPLCIACCTLVSPSPPPLSSLPFSLACVHARARSLSSWQSVCMHVGRKAWKHDQILTAAAKLTFLFEVPSKFLALSSLMSSCVPNYTKQSHARTRTHARTRHVMNWLSGETQLGDIWHLQPKFGIVFALRVSAVPVLTNSS